jgi:hypothetical protein
MSALEYVAIFARASVYGVIAGVCTTLGIVRSSKFRRNWYWWLLSFALANALISPLAYVWINRGFSVSLRDAFLLRPFHFGIWLVAEGYAVLVGVAVGGLVGLLKTASRRS